jgi:CRP-like cAMP-binding protein
MGDATRLLPLATTILSRKGWLSEQPAELRANILDSVRVRRVDSGGVLFRHGERPEGVFGLVSGHVKFRISSREGRELVQGLTSSGSWFGEVSLFDGEPRAQDAVALGPVVAALFPIDRFRAVTEAHPQYLRNFAQIMARNIREMTTFTYEVASAPPSARIERLLGFLLQHELTEAYDSSVILDVGQETLAAVAGLSRQTVNRELKRLAEAGVVECRYGRVVVDAGVLRGFTSVDAAAGLSPDHEGSGRARPASPSPSRGVGARAAGRAERRWS